MISEKGPLPHKLLLQMDNCVRENKNKFVMAFLAFLVERKIFVEVIVIGQFVNTCKMSILV